MLPGRRIQLLDGAMGTQLEALGHDVSGPMWGSDLLHSNPRAIGAVHKGYAEAGADIVETATYQMSLEPLLKDHTQTAAEGIMRGAINLVSSSIDSKQEIALSLGPYGATLSPSQEYGGIYPPPYGPTQPAQSGITLSNAFPRGDNQSAESKAEEALEEWHFSRLMIYAGEEEVWRKVGWLAFETIPLLYEVVAIRRAVGRLYEKLGERWGKGKGEREWWRKKFWITSAFPNGLHPQHVFSTMTKSNLGAEEGDILHHRAGMLLDKSIGQSPKWEKPLPPADGVGINCTHPQYIESVLLEFLESMISRSLVIGGKAPVFILYPDGGAVYDTTSRTWTERTTEPDEWAMAVARIARIIEALTCNRKGDDGVMKREKVWGGVIVGGCCKAGFEEIRSLRAELDD